LARDVIRSARLGDSAGVREVTPDTALCNIAVIIEECCESHYDRENGLREPITREEWLAIRNRVNKLVEMNLPRVEATNE
jgi:hypothetical protein